MSNQEVNTVVSSRKGNCNPWSVVNPEQSERQFQDRNFAPLRVLLGLLWLRAQGMNWNHVNTVGSDVSVLRREYDPKERWCASMFDVDALNEFLEA